MLTNLRFIRLKKEIPLWQLASAVQLSPGQISKIETGRIKPKINDLRKIAEQLGCGIDGLLDRVS